MTAAGLENRRAKLAIIHVAKKKSGLSEEHYRALLEGSAKVSTAADIEEERQFEAVMRSFSKLGFSRSHSRPVDEDRWGCTMSQRRYIEALWRRYARVKTDEALYHFIRRTTGVDHPRFLTRRRASEVILGIQKLQRDV